MLPKLTIRNHVLRDKILFLEVLLDEILEWKEHIEYAENHIEKILRLLCLAWNFLERNSLLALYYS